MTGRWCCRSLSVQQSTSDEDGNLNLNSTRNCLDDHQSILLLRHVCETKLALFVPHGTPNAAKRQIDDGVMEHPASILPMLKPRGSHLDTPSNAYQGLPGPPPLIGKEQSYSMPFGMSQEQQAKEN